MSDNLERENSSSAFPLRWPTTARDDRGPEIIEFDDERAAEVIDALSSDTARVLMSHLHDEPQTASDLAEKGDTTVQNAKYHLEKFLKADLVEVIDVWYSSRGAEMKVYSPTNKSLILYTGESPDEKSLRDMLSRIFGTIGILGITSIFIDQIARGLFPVSTGQFPENYDGVVNTTNNMTFNGTMNDPGIIGIPVTPGLVFFTGGLFILLLGAIRWYW